MKGGYDPQWGYDYKAGIVEVTDHLELPYSLTSSFTDGGSVAIDARANVGYWKGTINFIDLTATALTENIKLIDAFPAKYKILEIMVDIVAAFDDGAGPVSACTLSVGWTAANYDDLIQTQDIYTGATQYGDSAGELNYTAVQGGIRPSWSAPSDIYARFVAVGGNLDTLTAGRATFYITYQAF